MSQIFNTSWENYYTIYKDKVKFNFILLDMPYNTTPLTWDKDIVDLVKLWEFIDNVSYDNTVVVSFGQEPFSSRVRLSNIKNYKYDWYWVKERLTNVFQVKRRPGKTVETISVFYKSSCTYHPDKLPSKVKKVTNNVKSGRGFSKTIKGNTVIKPTEYRDDGTRHPTQVLNFNRETTGNTNHDTQKPYDLIEFLIKTYTNEGDVILDPFAGSGVTGVVCQNLRRDFVLIENRKEQTELIINRLNPLKDFGLVEYKIEEF